MSYSAVKSAWDQVSKQVETNITSDQASAKELFDRKRREAEQKVQAAERAKAAAEASGNPGAIISANIALGLAKMHLQRTLRRIALAQAKLDTEIAQLRTATTRFGATFINTDLIKGKDTVQTFTRKKREWENISTQADGLWDEVNAKGAPASWMSTEASENYSDAVRPQLAALQDLSISASHNAIACKGVADIQRSMYKVAQARLLGARSNLSSFGAEIGADMYGRNVMRSRSQLRELRSWANGFFAHWDFPTRQVSGTYEAAVTAAGNMRDGWPQRTSHKVNESENGDLNTNVSIANAAAGASVLGSPSGEGWHF